MLTLLRQVGYTSATSQPISRTNPIACINTPEAALPMPTNILKIRKLVSARPITIQPSLLDVRVMFLTDLAVSLEGEEGREEALIEAWELSEDSVDLGCHSEAAATTSLFEGLH